MLKKIILIGLLLVLVTVLVVKLRRGELITVLNEMSVVKSNGFCNNNEDCEYFWFTGVCHTSEYVAKIQKENDAIGLRNGEVPARQNVKCLCEKSKCVTKN